MSTVSFLQRMRYILEVLQHRPCSFAALKEAVLLRLESDDFAAPFSFSARTFQRDREAIAFLWGIELLYDKTSNTYALDRSAQEPSAQRLLDAFTLHHALKAFPVSPVVYFEPRKPNGTSWIPTLLKAIQSQKVVQFTHTKFWIDEVRTRKVFPLALKEAQHRWYLVGWDMESNALKNFGLDRMDAIKLTLQTYTPPPIELNSHYAHAFGIETYAPVTRIVLRCSWQQGNYLKSFPLHPSQIQIATDDTTTTFAVTLHPTNDFIMELLRYGAEIEVLEPQSLRDEMATRLTEAYQLYRS